MPEFEFTGEESSRFVKFADTALEAGIDLKVDVQGRDPLTSEHLRIVGEVTDVWWDGYIRAIQVVDERTNAKYDVGGSNATRSIAANRVTFKLTDNKAHQLRGATRAPPKTFVPGLSEAQTESEEVLEEIVNASKDGIESVPKLLEYLEDNKYRDDTEILEEIATSIRALEDAINNSADLREDVERTILDTLPDIEYRLPRIYFIEVLGYIGTEQSLTYLRNLLVEDSNDDHIRWAAAIALGRLPSEDVIEPIIQGLESNHKWTVAGCLLQLTRRTDEVSHARLESIFSDYLTADSDQLFKQYACLGLSRIENISSETAEELADLLAVPSEEIEVKGYTALALTSCIRESDEEFISSISKIVADLRTDFEISSSVAILGVEYIAELASFLGENSKAADLHDHLSEVYTNWKERYHRAYSVYYRAEAEIKDGDSGRANELLTQALQSMPDGDLPAESQVAIEFRRNILDARLSIQRVVHDWKNVIQVDRLERLVEDVKRAEQIYTQYSQDHTNVQNSKELSARQTAYVGAMREIAEIIETFLRMDIQRRRGELNHAEVHETLRLIANAAKDLRPALEENLADDLVATIDEIERMASRVSRVFDDPSKSGEAKSDAVRDLLDEVKTSFVTTTWPMPARTCPVSGLGHGSITLRTDNVEGTGTYEDPYTFPTDDPALLNIIVEIDEMAPGSRTTPLLEFERAGVTEKTEIPVREGSYTDTHKIPDKSLSTSEPLKCTIKLIFQNPDCQQESDELDVWVRQRTT